jgi:XapX domain-containing protein
MKMYLISLGAGILVGAIYALLNVRSPAPPVVALIGLLGILIGEQAVPIAKRLMSSEPVNTSWLKKECVPHILGTLPVGETAESTRVTGTSSRKSASDKERV